MHRSAKVIGAALLALSASPIAAQAPSKEVWACVNELMVGITDKADNKTYAGSFNLDPARFFLTINAFGASRWVSFSPDFVLAMEERSGPVGQDTFRQDAGFGWLIFRPAEGVDGRTFRLGYVDGTSQYLMSGRCLKF
jgi:hypothetical protein